MAVNRNVGGSNPPRGAKSFLDKHLLTALFSSMKNVVRLSGFSTGRAIRIVRKPNVFPEKIIGSVPTIRFGAESLMSVQRSRKPLLAWERLAGYWPDELLGCSRRSLILHDFALFGPFSGARLVPKILTDGPMEPCRCDLCCDSRFRKQRMIVHTLRCDD